VVKIETNATVQKYTLTKTAGKWNPRNPFGKDISPLTLYTESFGPVVGVDIVRGDTMAERSRRAKSPSGIITLYHSVVYHIS
jgi:hypothetical protein